MKKTLVFAAATVICSTNAQASKPTDGNNYFYVGAGAVSLKKKQPLTGAVEETNPSYTVGLGREIHPHIAVEAVYSSGSTTYNNLFTSQEADVSLSQIAVSLVPATDYLGDTSLKLVGRMSVSFVKRTTDYQNIPDMTYESSTGVMVDAGIGLHWDINRRLIMRAEYITNVTDHSLGDLSKNYDYNGAQFTLGYRF
ncbi:outer membrane beta-barrel protein [Photobacterium sp. 53610]|uniref:outer membrane beta-barrel protein n=1 Tax=Photobacterium sp. 53610 TaxID=3102789 RepID=UPI002EDA0995